MIKPWLKLLLLRSRIRKHYFECTFGPEHSEKYEEYFKWFRRAIDLEGDVLEFGVASGGTTCLMAQKLLESGKQKTIHSFDSFQGFDPKEFDDNYARGDVTVLTQKDAFRATQHSLAYVRLKLKLFGFSHLVRLHPGYFQETLRPFLDLNSSAQFCFALIDCDLASSVQFCVEAIYDRITPGGVILFDDYRSFSPYKVNTSYSVGVQRSVHALIESHAPMAHGYINGLYHFVK